MELSILNNIDLIKLTDNKTETPINEFDIYKITGSDKFDFLQGQITNDINLLKTEQAICTAYCNIKGRLMGVFFLYLTNIDNEEIIYLINPGNNGLNIFKSLKKYGLFSKININKVTDEFNVYLINTESEEKDDLISIEFPNNKLTLKLINKTKDVNILNNENLDNNFWKITFINSKIPIISQITNEQFLSHNLELPKLNIINFKKGCYLGQEIIARTEYKAKLKKSALILSGMSSNTNLNNNLINSYFLQNNENIKTGEVIDYCIIKNKIYLLASIDNKYISQEIKFIN